MAVMLDPLKDIWSVVLRDISKGHMTAELTASLRVVLLVAKRVVRTDNSWVD